MKPRVYSLYEAMTIVGTAARKGKPRAYIWVETAKGPAKLLRPLLRPDGLFGSMMVSTPPRYQFSVTNYPA